MGISEVLTDAVEAKVDKESVFVMVAREERN
jgi:hypothetical protein